MSRATYVLRTGRCCFLVVHFVSKEGFAHQTHVTIDAAAGTWERQDGATAELRLSDRGNAPAPEIQRICLW